MAVADMVQVESRVRPTVKNQYPRETIRRRLFTLEEYEFLIKIGFLGEDDKVELINGEILEMSPIGISHAASVTRLTHYFGILKDDTTLMSIQNPIVLPPNSEPEPDVVLLQYRDGFYENTRPGPSDVLLLVEVADSSLDYDRNVKLPRYAMSGIPEVWLVNLAERRVEVYSHPQGQDYQIHQVYQEEQTVQSVTMPNIALLVEQIIGTD